MRNVIRDGEDNTAQYGYGGIRSNNTMAVIDDLQCDNTYRIGF